MFRKQKTIEATSFLLSSLDEAGTGLPYIKLIKLLYIADREMLRQKRRTITGDDHWSMKFGPVLENTLEMIKDGDQDWNEHFETDLDAKVISESKTAKASALSRAEIKVLKDVAEKFGHLPWPRLVEITHEFPEWREMKSGRSKIYLWEMAKAVGFTDQEAKEIADYNDELNDIQIFQDQIKALGETA